MIKIDCGYRGAPVYYANGNMTWRKLADFINNYMPECNKDDAVRVWNSGDDGFAEMKGGQFCDCTSISTYDDDEESSSDNPYFIGFNGDDCWW